MIWPQEAALTGERVGYFILTAGGVEEGRREALFNCSAGFRPPQEADPLSYNRTSILVSVVGEAGIARAKLDHLLRHEHGLPYLAAPRRLRSWGRA
jgi:hypothetical protein